MKRIIINYPKTAEDAIRTICYLKAWRIYQLAHAIGLKDASQLSRIINGRIKGSDELRDRILQHMPEKLKKRL